VKAEIGQGGLQVSCQSASFGKRYGQENQEVNAKFSHALSPSTPRVQGIIGGFD
jgi:hypothetical protein